MEKKQTHAADGRDGRTRSPSRATLHAHKSRAATQAKLKRASLPVAVFMGELIIEEVDGYDPFALAWVLESPSGVRTRALDLHALDALKSVQGAPLRETVPAQEFIDLDGSIAKGVLSSVFLESIPSDDHWAAARLTRQIAQRGGLDAWIDEATGSLARRYAQHIAKLLKPYVSPRLRPYLIHEACGFTPNLYASASRLGGWVTAEALNSAEAAGFNWHTQHTESTKNEADESDGDESQFATESFFERFAHALNTLVADEMTELDWVTLKSSASPSLLAEHIRKPIRASQGVLKLNRLLARLEDRLGDADDWKSLLA